MKRVVGYLLDFVLALIGAALIGLMPAPTLWTECAQLFFLTAFFCRDCITGQSIGRRVMHLCVMHDGTPISPGRAFIRNLFLVLWPVELLVWMVNDGRRIGDVVVESHIAESDMLPLRIRWQGVAVFAAVWLALFGLCYYWTTQSDLLQLLYAGNI
ncbi:hypothetical protein [uncultured Alistipes sp.]|jgi:hypothetical protein|uniref:hypothetical protein n=1 Tax=uncultured Alistipes sp. TaxID=538949 RepID=UPI0025E1EFA3|nr:hypothetical protein [uncultured Alistipes sp.]